MDYIKNGFEDDDALALLQRVEELEDQKASVMASARGECSGIAKQIKNALAEAKELNIPRASFNGWRKKRKHERAIKAIESSIPEEEIEVYLEGSGQFSLFAPTDNADDQSEEQVDSEQDQFDAAEQAEGEEVLTRKPRRSKPKSDPVGFDVN